MANASKIILDILGTTLSCCDDKDKDNCDNGHHNDNNSSNINNRHRTDYYNDDNNNNNIHQIQGGMRDYKEPGLTINLSYVDWC